MLKRKDPTHQTIDSQRPIALREPDWGGASRESGYLPIDSRASAIKTRLRSRTDSIMGDDPDHPSRPLIARATGHSPGSILGENTSDRALKPDQFPNAEES